MKRVLALIAVAAAFTSPPALAQRDFSKVEIQATRITDTLYAMTGSGGNLGVCVGEDFVFVIDDQYAPLSEKIAAAIGKVSPKPVRFIVNTHWHGDHTGGNENFARGGAIIVAHENVRKRMGSEQFLEVLGGKIPASPPAALPVVTFTGAVSFHMNGEEIRVLHVPNAHTDGDAIVHFLGSDVIHMGDVYWNGLYPFIDYGSGGSVEGTIAAVDTILGIATDRTKVIAGHGSPVSGKAELKAYRDMLATISTRVRELVRQGRKLEEIVAANVSAEYDDSWGKTFLKGPKFVEMLAKPMIQRGS
jgi:glyoxylase-like metal-dependent hydrolase (beta-lactamase superfamily II)